MTASARETILRIEHLTKRFPLEGGKVLTACDDVTFPVYRGEILGIVGESGCGKSTLVRTLMQLHPPSEGQIFFKDQEITGLKGEDARNMRRNIQMVFQDPTTSFNPKMKIKDIICEPLRNFGILEGSARDKAAELLRLVDLPEEFAERYPANMSGGQRQRVAIARAMAMQPKVLLFDEPTSALDPEMVDEVLAVIRKLASTGITMVIVTHEMSFARDVASRIIFLDGGKIIEDGTPEKVIKHSRHAKVRSFFEALTN